LECLFIIHNWKAALENVEFEESSGDDSDKAQSARLQAVLEKVEFADSSHDEFDQAHGSLRRKVSSSRMAKQQSEQGPSNQQPKTASLQKSSSVYVSDSVQPDSILNGDILSSSSSDSEDEATAAALRSEVSASISSPLRHVIQPSVTFPPPPPSEVSLILFRAHCSHSKHQDISASSNQASTAPANSRQQPNAANSKSVTRPKSNFFMDPKQLAKKVNHSSTCSLS
jgi:hypothetical protein